MKFVLILLIVFLATTVQANLVPGLLKSLPIPLPVVGEGSDKSVGPGKCTTGVVPDICGLNGLTELTAIIQVRTN